MRRFFSSITTPMFRKAISGTSEPIVIDFFATWCGPCRMMEPHIKAAVATSNVKFLKVDIDSNQEIAQEYKVASVPTVVMVKDGKELKRFVGAKDRASIEKWIKE